MEVIKFFFTLYEDKIYYKPTAVDDLTGILIEISKITLKEANIALPVASFAREAATQQMKRRAKKCFPV